jgi:acetate kinase
VPEDWYVRHGVRRYGFHGTSHRYVAARAAVHLGKPLAALNLITLHLGNGASAAAIRAGCCVDTSMGFTPLEGLMMGTRCGDIDPALPLHMAQAGGMTVGQVDAVLNQDSGLRGICGDNDMRRIQERAASGDPAARLALDMYCYRVRKYIGAYAAILERVDAIVFTAGIGENSATVRRAVCSGLGALGIELDEDRNQVAASEVTEIQSGGARLRVLVIRTNEELEIARQTLACVSTLARRAPVAEEPDLKQ